MTTFNILGVTALVILFIMSISQLGIFYYRYAQGEGRSVIGFKEFRDYFSINPDKWDLDKDRWNRVTYTDEFLADEFFSHYKTYKFQFTFRDYIRYYHWIGHYFSDRDAVQKVKQQNTDMLGLLKCVQKDIDKLRADTEKERQETAKKVEEIKYYYMGGVAQELEKFAISAPTVETKNG